VGKTALHDMTMIVPGKSKGAAFVNRVMKKGSLLEETPENC
jgi:hypothetical protein